MSRIVHPRLSPKRGAARSTSWWGKAWVRAVEEASYSEADLRTARTLSRSGRVGGITTDDGEFLAAVADGDEMWTVAGTVEVFDAATAEAFVETVAAESGRIAALLGGDLPYSLVEHAEEAGAELLPYGGELATSCSCEPWADPCPHALAVLYQLAWVLDADPLVLLQLRGLSRDDLLARLHAAAPAVPGRDLDDEDLELALDAAARAARALELLDDPEHAIDHLF